MDGISFEKAVTALACWREMDVFGYPGMIAVGCVARNNALKGEFGGTIYGNITGHNQYSSMTVKGDSDTVRWPNARDPVFQKLLAAMDGLFDNTLADTTQGSRYYANLSTANSPWFQQEIVNQPELHPRVMQMGSTFFFK
jgi:hypothetical protein